MKNNLKTPIRDVKSSDTAYSQKTQSLEVAKSFLWRSLCYCFFQDATEKNNPLQCMETKHIPNRTSNFSTIGKHP